MCCRPRPKEWGGIFNAPTDLQIDRVFSRTKIVLPQIQKYPELIQRGSAASTYAQTEPDRTRQNQTEPPRARTRPAIDSLPGSGDRWLRRRVEDGSDHSSKIIRPGLGDIIVTEGAPANTPVLTQLGAAVIRKHQLVNASTKALQQTSAVLP